MEYLINYLPIIIQLGVVLGFVVGTIIVTHLLGPKRKGAKKLEAFECGIESEGNARMPVSVKYFMVAILFVLFDVEVIFLYPWAVNFQDWLVMGKDVLLEGFLQMLLFMGMLLLGFVYIIKKGALKWE